MPQLKQQQTKNYITPKGALALKTELNKLLNEERPKLTEIIAWAAGNGDRSENGDYIYGKKRLREVDSRIRFLSKRIEIIEEIDPCQQHGELVLFGATVTIADESENKRVIKIVGVDEIDVDKGKISWISPLGKALLQKKAGDIVTFHSPKGEQEVEIIEVKYESIE